MGIKELDVTFSKIYKRIENSNTTPIIDLMEDLLDNETQYIFDLFFNEVSKGSLKNYKYYKNPIGKKFLGELNI